MWKFLQKLGPGFILAGAAIGVSHLVQATRAGADYGLSLWWILLLACLTKYPFLLIGPLYASATGKNLIQGYKQLGRFPFYLFIVITLGTMFIILSAVTMVTAGIAEMIFSQGWSTFTWSLIIHIFIIILLLLGRYGVLDLSMKIIISILTISTITAVILSLVNFKTSDTSLFNNFVWDSSSLLFLIAFMGWMPIPLDAAVWHSLWTLEKNRDTGDKLNVKQATTDFNAGYLIATGVGVLFMLLGALVMFGSSGFSDNSVSFSGQLINMYTTTLGEWTWPLIAGAAITTMFSTTLAVADAYPRVTVKTIEVIETNWINKKVLSIVYNFSIIIISFVSLLFIYNMKNSFKTMVDFATSISFLSAPVLAWLNISLIRREDFPNEYKPKKLFFIFSYGSFIFLTLFCLVYIYTKWL
jgi:Mn2+/Fe2+ NRAMP family transporter